MPRLMYKGLVATLDLATYVGEAWPVDKEVTQGRGEGGIVDVHLVLAPADTI
jgi:hypothetical protein